MIYVSILNWETFYWVNYSSLWAEVSTITEEEFITLKTNLDSPRAWFYDIGGGELSYLWIYTQWNQEWYYSFTIDDIDTNKINAWYTITIDGATWDLIYTSNTDSNTYEIESKRQKMQSLIDLYYPLETRLSYITAWVIDSADTNFTTMNTYINGIKSEFVDNGKDADFTARE
jgi:hypothetical protein